MKLKYTEVIINKRDKSGDNMTYETTSQNTKKMIEKKFKELVSEKPFSKVTISEIIKECNINRKTFYYHFEDIYALLKWTLQQEAISVVNDFNLLTEFEEAIYFILSYIEKNNAFLKNIYCSVGRDELKKFLYNDFINIVSNTFEIKSENNKNTVPIDFKEFFINFYTEAIASTLIDYINRYPDINKEKTVKYICVIINNTELKYDFN